MNEDKKDESLGKNIEKNMDQSAVKFADQNTEKTTENNIGKDKGDNKKVKLKGKLNSYLMWPLFMLILFALVTICIFTLNIRAGLNSLAACLI